MSQQELKGKAKKARGKVKQAVGIISGDKKMEQKGALHRAEGAVQEGLGMVSRKVGEFLTDIGHAIKK